MAPAIAAVVRDALRRRAGRSFVPLRGRSFWNPSAPAAALLGRDPGALTPADLDLLAEAHAETGRGDFLTAAVAGALAANGTDGPTRFRDAFLAAAAARHVGLEAAAAELTKRARAGRRSGGSGVDEAAAGLAEAVLLGVGSRRRARRRMRRAVAERPGGAPGPLALLHGTIGAVLDGGLARGGELAKRRLEIEEDLAWLTAPDGMLVPVGDTAPRVMSGAWAGKGDTGRVEAAYRHPAMRHAASAGAVGEPPADGWRVWHDQGLAVGRLGQGSGRAGAGYLVLSGGGAHADGLSVAWFAGGRWLLADPGHPGDRHADPSLPAPERMAAYVKSAGAHSTVSAGSDGAAGRARPLRWGRDGGALWIDAIAEPDAGRHRRSVVAGATWLLLVDRVDGLQGPVHRRLHSPGSLDVAPHDEGFVVSAEGSPAAWVASAGDAGEPGWPVRGSDRGVLRGWSAGWTGRPVPAWDYGWEHGGPFASATLLTAEGPAEGVVWEDEAVAWSAGGRRFTVRLDAGGVAGVEREGA